MSERSKPPGRSTGGGAAGSARDLVGGGAWSRAEVEQALGQPLLTDDPMLTTRQASVLLGLSVGRLHYLVRKGRAVPTGGARHARWRLADLAAIQHDPPPREPPSDPMCVGRLSTHDAAALLGVSRRTFHRWAATGKVAAVRDSAGRWWARREDLETLRRGDDGQGPVHASRVPSADAAALLGVAPATFRAAAAAGTVPAVKDAAGRWWARPEHLLMIRRARQAEAEQDRASSPPA